MKKLGKILLIGAGVLCVLLIVAINVTIGWRPWGEEGCGRERGVGARAWASGARAVSGARIVGVCDVPRLEGLDTARRALSAGNGSGRPKFADSRFPGHHCCTESNS